MPGRHIDRPHILIGDEERYACTDLLSEHHARGRLSTEEVGSRIDAALRARTAADLEEVLADPPAPRRTRPRPGWHRSVRPLPSP